MLHRMRNTLSNSRLPRRGALACAATAVLALAGAADAGAADAGAATVSSNWSGYVASPVAAAGFSSVSGTWTQPAATCSAGSEAYSAVWVGLGGDREGADALEQVGTDVDCSSAGRAVYSAWYELIPAGPVSVAMRVRPGDRLSASVTVKGHGVTLRIRDLTTGAHFSTTKRIANVDVSSAEWIVEAPSVCFASGACGLLPLTDFGSVSFSDATATVGGHTGTIADPDWSATALELRQDAARTFRARRRPGRSAAVVSADPSAASAADGSFTVTWQELSAQAEAPSAPSLPGFNGGQP